MYRQFSFLFLILVFNISFVQSQNFMPRGVCGVSAENQFLAEHLHPIDFRGQISGDRNQKIYVPVKFHLTANNEGIGRIEWNHVLNQLCILNRDFESSNMVFYIYQGFNFLDLTNAYENPGTSTNLLTSRKDNKALNIFITENADPGNVSLGTVLGYYSPQGDYVVTRKLELVNKTNTLSHEIGHFFSLRHTFFGWEGVPYNKSIHGEKVTFNFVPNGIPGVPVEVMGSSNCDIAADMICDTPPDYNFGTSASNCTFTTTVFDKNDERVIPMKENQMGYFSNCDTFKFTPLQSARMLNNFNSGTRTYLRSNYVPKQDTIVGIPQILTPTAGQVFTVFDDISLSWTPIEHATHYLVEIRGSGQYYPFITTNTNIKVTSLRKSQFYSWSVRPFNETYTCAPARTSTFRTGAGTVSTEELDHITAFNVYPNPANSSDLLTLEVLSDKVTEGSFIVSGLDGKEHLQMTNQKIVNGSNLFSVSLNGLSYGVYMIRFQSKEGISVRRFVVQ
ncbi:MAG: T9SS type A sorting domain-containing protein [Saprospiraceae bacterium]|nr:T9SS type A sorting domain-containing protein [Saprospiraceae bacterium]